MKKGKFLATLSIAALLALTSCGGSQPEQSEVDKAIHAIYTLYADSTENAKSYEEWLAEIKGPKGDKGDKGDPGTNGSSSVVTIDPTTGNWLIDGVDTGVHAQGEKGDQGAPGAAGQNGQDGKDGTNGTNGVTPHIGENGNWFIGDQDTGIKAQGADGAAGQNGTNGTNGVTPHIDETTGHWFIGETDTGVEAQGPKGDTGAAGDQGEKGDQGVSVVNVTTTTTSGLNGAAIITFVFTLSNGETIVQTSKIGYSYSDYSLSSFNAENKPVLTNEKGAEVVIDKAEKGSLTIDGSNEDAVSEYVTITKSSDYPFVWNAAENRYESGNNGRDSTNSYITFTAVKDIALSLDLTCGGESTYDYTTSSVTLDAVMTVGKTTDNSFSSSGKPVDANYHHEYFIPAGSAVTYNYKKDSSQSKNMDGAWLYNIKVFNDDIPLDVNNFAVVNFDSVGGPKAKPIVVNKGGLIGELPEVKSTNNHKVFDGWFVDAALTTAADENIVANDNMTLYAKWADGYVVNLHYSDGTTKELTVKEGTSFAEEVEVAEGDVFRGWFKDAAFAIKYNGEPIYDDIDLYAKVEELRGHSFAKAINVGALAEEAIFGLEFNDLVGREMFFTYTAEEATMITIDASFENYFYTKVYDATMSSELSAKEGRSASTNKVAKLRTGSGNNFTRVNVDAGETIVVKIYTSSSGEGKVTFKDQGNVANLRYENATTLTVDADTNLTANSNFVYYYKYTPDTDAQYYLSVTSDAYASIDLLELKDDGTAFKTRITYVSNSSSGTSGKAISLSAGKTYYFVATVNYDDTAFSFKLGTEAPVGNAPMTPAALTLGEEYTPVFAGGDAFYGKFVAPEEGVYTIKTEASSLYLYDNANYTGTSKTLNKVAGVANTKYVQLAAGTYYVKETMSSYGVYPITVANPAAGSITENAIAYEGVINGESDPVTLNVNSYYKYKPTEAAKFNVTVPAGAKLEVKTRSNGSGYDPTPSVSVIATIDATEANGPVTGAINLSKNTEYYLIATALSGETVTVTPSEFVGPLTGKDFLGKVFNGAKDAASNYYNIKFAADGFYWDDSPSLTEVNAIDREADGVTYFHSSSYELIATNGVEAFVVDNPYYDTGVASVYFYSSRSSKYGSSHYLTKVAKTSPLTSTTGTCVYSMILDDETTTYAVLINGVAYFDVDVTLGEGVTDISANGATYSFTLGGKTYNCEKGSQYLTITEATPVDPVENVEIALSLGEWADANAQVYAWVWGTNTTSHWVKAENGKLVVPAGVTGLKLIRMNPEGCSLADANDFDNGLVGTRWNSTGDIAYTADKVLTFSAWDVDGVSTFIWE